jgi:hypothetical protein
VHFDVKFASKRPAGEIFEVNVHSLVPFLDENLRQSLPYFEVVDSAQSIQFEVQFSFTIEAERSKHKEV